MSLDTAIELWQCCPYLPSNGFVTMRGGLLNNDNVDLLVGNNADLLVGTCFLGRGIYSFVKVYIRCMYEAC